MSDAPKPDAPVAVSCCPSPEDEDALAAWPNCAVPDCAYKSCVSLDSSKCYAHTLGITPIDPAIYFGPDEDPSL